MMRDVHKLDVPSYQVDTERHHRFDQRQTVFGRMLHDPRAPFYRRSMYNNCGAILARYHDGYSRIAYCVACVAEFIRSLGYHALPMGNDTALSIPLSIDAGLGELGRLGLLVTPEHGPCVRISKIFTDIPLVPDRPVAFGVREFCSQCTRCADACHAKAIQQTPQPSFNVVCPSNNTGIERWAVDHDRCYGFWIENGSDCSNCIAACPYTPCSK
ncbi:4Fe-4S dicluster domain-containing protein [candidate division WOR-3 bacterium]|nr:4Fe-4S dicluster domain-containing protein [candidate division WOR-3 bacterium]